MFQIPEEDVAGFLYPWVNNDGTAGSAVVLFGGGIGDPIMERFEAEEIPAGMDFDDWRVRGFTMKVGEPHKTVALKFEGERVQIDCHYDAIHPVYAFSFHKDGCPPYYADDRTEQHGRLTGTLTVDGKRYDLDTFMQRDHSWGPRVWGLNQHYKWYHATTAESAVHFFEMQSFGKVNVRGYVFKDGQMAEVRGLDYDYTFDENMHHSTFDVTVTDSAGRDTRIDAVIYAKFTYPVDPMIQLNEGATTVTIDGVPGSGWCEFCWNKEYLDFARQYAAQYA